MNREDSQIILAEKSSVAAIAGMAGISLRRELRLLGQWGSSVRAEDGGRLSCTDSGTVYHAAGPGEALTPLAR